MSDVTRGPSVPPGFCQCGCGAKTSIAKRNRFERGVVKGQPLRYVPDHVGRSRLIERPPLPRNFVDEVPAPALPDELLDVDELWLPVVDYEGLYEVSSQGRVRSLGRRVRDGRIEGAFRLRPGRMLRLAVDAKGYQRATLSKDGDQHHKQVHRLVCESFRGGTANPQLQARHLNGDPSDNRAENLVWGTAKENAQDTILLGRNHEMRKTHCKEGHVFSIENTYVNKRGHRECRVCHRIREQGRKRQAS